MEKIAVAVPKRRIALSSNSEHGIIKNEKEKGFTDILSSISRAQKQRQQLQEEFRRQNTLQYCLLEAGAETFEFSLVYLRQFHGVVSLLTDAIARLVVPSFRRFVQVKTQYQILEDTKISELKMELIKLREEMSKMSGQALKATTTEIAKTHVDESSIQSVGECTQQQRPGARPLPFTADMLQSAKMQQKTPIRIVDRSAPQSKEKSRENESIQHVLQRALEQKFKNVRQMESEDLDTSFDSESFQSLARRNPHESENQSTIPKPPIPPRPKISKAASSSHSRPKKVLADAN